MRIPDRRGGAAKRLVALVPNVPGFAPGQRTRIESWTPYLERAGWNVEMHSFEDARLHEILYQPGHIAAKASHLMTCYSRHLATVKDLEADVVLLYREAALVGPALSERWLARRNVPIVYDLDDPVWLPYRSPTSDWFSLLKFSAKTKTLFRLADHVIAINRRIGDYASRFNSAVTVIPNYVDTERYKPREKTSEDQVRLVWSGSHGTIHNLSAIEAPLRRLQRSRDVPLRVVGKGTVPLSGVDVEMREWSPETEVRDLVDCHIGLVPLTDHPWNAWKFFLKIVQYMAVGLPVVARRLPSTEEVISEGHNGFLVESDDEWYDRLMLLVEDAGLRNRMGEAARVTALEKYSIDSQMPRVTSVFEAMLPSACL